MAVVRVKHEAVELLHIKVERLLFVFKGTNFVLIYVLAEALDYIIVLAFIVVVLVALLNNLAVEVGTRGDLDSFVGGLVDLHIHHEASLRFLLLSLNVLLGVHEREGFQVIESSIN